MASCSKGQIGALNAESFAERIISQCNLLCTTKNSLIGDEELSSLIMLRMNRDFMEFMRKNYADDIKKIQTFGKTVVNSD